MKLTESNRSKATGNTEDTKDSRGKYLMKYDDIHVAIISARRPENVESMMKFMDGIEPTWYVAKGDSQDYKLAGAKNVVEGGTLCCSRNAALDKAFKKKMTCVQLSDDLMGLGMAINKKNVAKMETIHPFLDEMLDHLDQSGLKLAGINPTGNAFYFDPLKPVKTSHFIIGDFCMIRPTDLRFDEEYQTKEDYDYTMQHIQKYGGVIRSDRLLCRFKHYTNKGGAVDIRNVRVEQESIKRLKQKWGSNIKDNPRRPNEILLKVR
jgi:hypothetical protein